MAAARRLGLTLVEVMAGTALLGTLLVAILLPSLAGARRQARRAVCAGNLRELGRFTAFFNADHRDRMPRSTHSAFAHRALPWGYAFYEYATGEPFRSADQSWTDVLNSLYRCPFDRHRKKTQWSYGYNVYFELTAIETGSRSWRIATEIPRPDATVLFGEVGDDSDSAMPDHVMAHFWTQFNAPPEVAQHRHEPDSAYVFVDGHAADVPFHRIFDMSNKKDHWNPAGMP